MKTGETQPIKQTPLPPTTASAAINDAKNLNFPPPFPAQDPNRLIRLKEVLTLVPVRSSTWWAWVAAGRAPGPIRLSSRCTCWRYSEVIAWTENMGNIGKVA